MMKTMGIVVVAALAARAVGNPANVTMTSDPVLNQLGRQAWQPCVVPLCPAI